ncbi:MAG: putative hydrolase [Bacillota bacterium]|jgi:putative hydrolase|nr:putative hydrolase [Bacillota bacterium]
MGFEADLHTHTVASRHAYSTIKEMAEAAAAKGIKLLGMTDHGINMPGGPHEYHFGNLTAIPPSLCGVEILRGVEANIIDSRGTLDMPEYLLERLDLVLAGFHVGTGYDGGSVEENTQAMIAALYNPYVHAIVHPGNPHFPVDIERVVLAAKAVGKALEINNSSFSVSRSGSRPRCELFARYIHRYKVPVIVSSDAHIYTAVGNFDQALEVAHAAGIRDEEILNYSAERVKSYLAELKRRQRLLSQRTCPVS